MRQTIVETSPLLDSRLLQVKGPCCPSFAVYSLAPEAKVYDFFKVYSNLGSDFQGAV